MTFIPLITIAIPCYNSASFIEEAVISACRQTYQNYEVLVIDNASTDGTLQILQKLQSDYVFTLIKNEKNLGAIQNFNLAIEQARGKYIKFLESDDVLEPECLSIMGNFLSDEVQFVCGSKFLINQYSQVIGRNDTNTRIRQGSEIIKSFRKTGNILGTPSDCLVSKALLMRVGGFSRKYGTYLNDLDVWLKICRTNAQVQFTSERICRVRRHSAQMGVIGGNSLMDTKVAFQMLEEDYFDNQRTEMEVHFGTAYVYRALRQLIKGQPSHIIKTLILIIRQMHLKTFLIIFYLPVYLLLLLKAKRNNG